MLKQYFPQGVRENGTTNFYYTRDHLGSVREVTDASRNLVARYDYDPWGRQTTTFGTKQVDFTYAGYFTYRTLYGTPLYLTWYRAYDPFIGRWLSRDPIGESSFMNLYSYTENNVINIIDQLGLCSQSPCVDPCGDALKYGLDNGDYGGIVCCAGKKYVCIWSKNSPYQQAQKLIDKCIRDHERDHVSDIDCPPFYGYGQLTRPGFKSGKNQGTEEISAYTIEIGCLKKAKSGCFGNPICIQEINNRIKFSIGMINSFGGKYK